MYIHAETRSAFCGNNGFGSWCFEKETGASFRLGLKVE